MAYKMNLYLKAPNTVNPSSMVSMISSAYFFDSPSGNWTRSVALTRISKASLAFPMKSSFLNKVEIFIITGNIRSLTSWILPNARISVVSVNIECNSIIASNLIFQNLWSLSA